MGKSFKVNAIICTLFAVSILLISCASPAQRAEKLFQQGKYQIIMDHYADVHPWADSAKAKLGLPVEAAAPVTATTTPAMTQSDHTELLTAMILSGYIARYGDTDVKKTEEHLSQARKFAQQIHQPAK